jgi:hypothetical protein
LSQLNKYCFENVKNFPVENLLGTSLHIQVLEATAVFTWTEGSLFHRQRIAKVFKDKKRITLREFALEPELLRKLAERETTKKELAEEVESNYALLPEVLAGVSSPKASVRYGCASLLVGLCLKHPERLYQHFGFFVSLLGSEHRILVWNGMAAIANLCVVDVDKKFDAIFDRYYAFLGDEYMVTVANVVGNSARIVRAKPYLASRVTEELLRVDRISTTPHLTEECTRVIAEKTVEAFSEFFDLIGDDDKLKVLVFVKEYATSSRASLRKEAQLFLNRWSL